jgi:chaperonin GroES
MNIQPLGNRVLVKLVKKAQTSTSGIIISTEEKTEQIIGEIVAIGGGSGEKNNINDLHLSVGQKVLFGQYSGEEIKNDSEPDVTYKIVNGKDIIATIN